MSDALKEISEAIYSLDHNEITVGEYEEKLKPWHDAEPIRHAYWVKDRLLSTNGGTYGVYRCSLCEMTYQDIGYGFNYCPNCGAKMDGE